MSGCRKCSGKGYTLGVGLGAWICECSEGKGVNPPKPEMMKFEAGKSTLVFKNGEPLRSTHK